MHKKTLHFVATERALGRDMLPGGISVSLSAKWEVALEEVGGFQLCSVMLRPEQDSAAHVLSFPLGSSVMEGVAWTIALLCAEARCSAVVLHLIGAIPSSDRLFTAPAVLSSHEIHRQYNLHIPPPTPPPKKTSILL